MKIRMGGKFLTMVSNFKDIKMADQESNQTQIIDGPE